MNEHRKKQLDDILNQFDKKQSEIQEKKERIKTDEEIFLDEYKRIRQEVIRPVFESIAATLKERGHDCEIEEKDNATDARGSELPPSITMKIYPSREKRSAYKEDSTPRISFMPQANARQVYTHVSTIQPSQGGSAGVRDYFKVNELDTDTVEMNVLKAVADIFSDRFR